jgi:hypothetical protein
LIKIDHHILKPNSMERKNILKILVCCTALLAGTTQLFAQANYWKFGSTYFNCTSGTVSGTPSNPVDLDASAFTVPGICQTYYRVNWVNIFGPPHRNALIISDISANTSGHPFNGSGDQYTLIDDGALHGGPSVAVAPLAADGSRKIYATYDNVIKSWTVSADGYITGPTTLYTYSSGTAFDSRTLTEVSSDGNYLLIKPLSGGMILFNLSSNTPTTYPSPTGTIIGYEYVTGWSVNPRIYISYNNMWFNPTGGGGFGYYDLGNTSTFNAVTSLPSGIFDPRGFGFTDIEKAKNGNLYLAHNPGLSTSISNPGPLYSFSSAGAWAAVPSVSITSGQFSNWGYYIQVQIDGENYNTATYPAPSIISFNLNGFSGTSTPNYTSTPVIYRCSAGALFSINALVSGMLRSYTISVRTGNINTSNAFIFDGGFYGQSVLSSANSFSIPLSSLGAALIADTGAIEVTFSVGNACTVSPPTVTRYFIIRNATVLAEYDAVKINGGFTQGKPEQTTLPITTAMPSVSSGVPASARLTAFKDAIDAAQGWQGASSAGVFNINTNGSYELRVYEADNIGNRKIISGDTAPDVCYFIHSGAVTNSSVRFGSRTLVFDATSNPNYLYDITFTNQDGIDYFRDYYNYARTNSALPAFSSKIWCVEFTVNTPQGCTAVKKSYFQIASSPLVPTGGNAKPGNGNDEGEDEAAPLYIYPNPAHSTVAVKMPYKFTKANLLLMDNSGRKVFEHSNLHAGKNEFDVQQLAPGIYFYEINIDGTLQHGKLIKQ